MASKTWIKNSLRFTFCDRTFARVRFYKSSFFILSFRHQDSNSYYLVVAAVKIPKVWKVSPSTSIFRHTNLKIVPLSIQNLSIVYLTLFPLLSTCLKTFVAIIKKQNPACLNDLVNSRQPANGGEKNSSMQKAHLTSSKEMAISFSKIINWENKFYLNG